MIVWTFTSHLSELKCSGRWTLRCLLRVCPYWYLTGSSPQAWKTWHITVDSLKQKQTWRNGILKGGKVWISVYWCIFSDLSASARNFIKQVNGSVQYYEMYSFTLMTQLWLWPPSKWCVKNKLVDFLFSLEP